MSDKGYWQSASDPGVLTMIDQQRRVIAQAEVDIESAKFLLAGWLAEAERRWGLAVLLDGQTDV